MKVRNKIPTSRPASPSLRGRSEMGIPNSTGSNKSVWQTFVDAAGFNKKHPIKRGK
tara:strand:- start:305 stop:472 length:168 start_codon:yes stop_codon:yes gene_type:complete